MGKPEYSRWPSAEIINSPAINNYLEDLSAYEGITHLHAPPPPHLGLVLQRVVEGVLEGSSQLVVVAGLPTSAKTTTSRKLLLPFFHTATNVIKEKTGNRIPVLYNQLDTISEVLTDTRLIHPKPGQLFSNRDIYIASLTTSFLSAIQLQDPKIKIVLHEQNAGTSAKINQSWTHPTRPFHERILEDASAGNSSFEPEEEAPPKKITAIYNVGGPSLAVLARYRNVISSPNITLNQANELNAAFGFEPFETEIELANAAGGALNIVQKIQARSWVQARRDTIPWSEIKNLVPSYALDMIGKRKLDTAKPLFFGDKKGSALWEKCKELGAITGIDPLKLFWETCNRLFVGAIHYYNLSIILPGKNWTVLYHDPDLNTKDPKTIKHYLNHF